VWRPVLGYEGIYEASTLGRVRILVDRHRIRAGNIVAQTPVRDGYLTVQLNRADGTRARCAAVSRVVFEAHNGPISPGHEVDHVDAVHTNNRLENLEAVPQLENIRRSVARGRGLGARNGSAKLTEALVLKVRARAAAGEPFDAIARDLDVTGVLVAGVAYGRLWRHVGGPRLAPRGRTGRPRLAE